MCHHGDEAVLESWREDIDDEEREAGHPADEEPSFLNEERDVDVDILEADDD